MDKKLDDLLDKFKKTRNHLFMVLNKFGGVSGIVTVEDVVEEIIGEEIVDEFDRYIDLQAVAKKRMQERKMRIV
jgi:CBS domain containing-hemolysin-like protein